MVSVFFLFTLLLLLLPPPQDDPWELHDLASTAAGQQKVRELTALLDADLDWRGADKQAKDFQRELFRYMSTS